MKLNVFSQHSLLLLSVLVGVVGVATLLFSSGRKPGGNWLTRFLDQVAIEIGAQAMGGCGFAASRLSEFGSMIRQKLVRLDMFAVVRMTAQLALLSRAGIQLGRSMSTLAKQETNPPLKQALEDIVTDLYEGMSLSKALSRHPTVFNSFYVSMVKVGETSGRFDQALDHLAKYLEQDLILRRRAAAALTYPMLVLAVCVTVVWVIFTWVFPPLMAIFASLTRTPSELPLPTRILQFVVNFCSNPWVELVFIVGVIFAWLCLQEVYKTSQGKLLIDKWKVTSPIVGPFHRNVLLTHFYRSLGTLMGQGIPILQALDVIIQATGNEYFKRRVPIVVREAVQEGVILSQVFKLHTDFSQIAKGMIKVGDDSGTTPEMLIRLADIYHEQVLSSLETLLTMLEPILIFICGILVGFVLLAIFMPLYNVVLGTF